MVEVGALRSSPVGGVAKLLAVADLALGHFSDSGDVVVDFNLMRATLEGFGESEEEEVQKRSEVYQAALSDVSCACVKEPAPHGAPDSALPLKYELPAAVTLHHLTFHD